MSAVLSSYPWRHRPHLKSSQSFGAHGSLNSESNLCVLLLQEKKKKMSSHSHLLIPSTIPLTTTSHYKLKGCWSPHGLKYLSLSARSHGFYPSRHTKFNVSCTMNMTGEQSDDPKRLNLDNATDSVRKVWESAPQPVKNFPWVTVAENFLQLINDLVYEVVKFLTIPVLAITSLSEMSYCAHERRMGLIPIPLLAGIAVAGILRSMALEISPSIKEREFPWHLAAAAVFFILLKLPGPYYPYWGRIFIPHFANGGLLRTLWFAYQWYRRVKEASGTNLQQSSVNANLSK